MHRSFFIAAWFCMFPGILQAQNFHTSPACWQSPRMAHTGPPSAEFANKLSIGTTTGKGPVNEPTVSPNRAYRFWIESKPDQANTEQTLVVDLGIKSQRLLTINDANPGLAPRWISEKLVFLRIPWGRIVFTDLIWDVEANELVFHEMLHDGTIAFEQYQAACAGQCPCNPQWTTAPLPQSEPMSGQPIGLLTLAIRTENSTETPAAADRIPIYSAPNAGAPIILQLKSWDQINTREIDYEEPAAVVLAKESNWFEVKLSEASQSGWINAHEPKQFQPLATLLPGRLAYLNQHWQGQVWNSIEADTAWQTSPYKARDPNAQEYPVDIQAVRETESGVWLQVAFYTTAPCEGGTPKLSPSVWVPAYNNRGQLSAWFWSRGC